MLEQQWEGMSRGKGSRAHIKGCQAMDRIGVSDSAAEGGDGYGGRLFCWFGSKPWNNREVKLERESVEVIYCKKFKLEYVERSTHLLFQSFQSSFLGEG